MIALVRSQRGKTDRISLVLLWMILPGFGCNNGQSASWLKNGLLDPSQVGDYEVQVSSEIRGSVSILEEPSGIEDAEEPSAEDLQPLYYSQKIGPGDMVGVSVYELQQFGTTTSLQVRVEHSGYATVPVLGRIRMVGYTPRELELELKRMLREREILQDADVQITLIASQAMQVALTGQGIARSGVYVLPRPDYRIHELIASAGGVSPTIEKIYVFRRIVPPSERIVPPEEAEFPDEPTTQEAEGLEGMAARLMMSDTSSARTSSLNQPPPPATQPEPVIHELDILEGRATSKPAAVPAQATPPTEAATPTETPTPTPVWDPERGEWVIEGEPESEAERAAEQPVELPAAPESETVPVEPGMEEPDAAEPPTSEPAEEESGEDLWDIEGELAPAVRIIEIPRQALMNGDPRYNIVLRPYDVVQVPSGDVGEFYLGGNIARPGAYSLTGRRLTVKEAIISAGGFNALAWPSRAQLIRRISPNEEQSIQLDLDAIFAMKAPDFYLKPNDIIQVGTTPLSPFLAVLRNAFRFTYGFGFVYDRNFADQDTFSAQLAAENREAQQRAARGLPP